jgi:hypothetical protein
MYMRILRHSHFFFTILSPFQYMTFPAQSSEKMSLVPVLAMLLQFSAKELSAVQRVAILEPAQTSIWGSFGLGGESKSPLAMPVFSSSRPAKEVKRPTVPIPAAVNSSPAASGRVSASGVKAGAPSTPQGNASPAIPPYHYICSFSTPADCVSLAALC